jgi:hypothetical protein
MCQKELFRNVHLTNYCQAICFTKSLLAHIKNGDPRRELQLLVRHICLDMENESIEDHMDLSFIFAKYPTPLHPSISHPHKIPSIHQPISAPSSPSTLQCYCTPFHHPHKITSIHPHPLLPPLPQLHHRGTRLQHPI